MLPNFNDVVHAFWHEPCKLMFFWGGGVAFFFNIIVALRSVQVRIPHSMPRNALGLRSVFLHLAPKVMLRSYFASSVNWALVALRCSKWMALRKCLGFFFLGVTEIKKENAVCCQKTEYWKFVQPNVDAMVHWTIGQLKGNSVDSAGGQEENCQPLQN